MPCEAVAATEEWAIPSPGLRSAKIVPMLGRTAKDQ